MKANLMLAEAHVQLVSSTIIPPFLCTSIVLLLFAGKDFATG